MQTIRKLCFEAEITHFFSMFKFDFLVSDDEPLDNDMLGATVVGDEDLTPQDYIDEWG